MQLSIITNDIYEDFRCIGGDCPMTCCGHGWGIYIDDSTYQKYVSYDDEFGEKLIAGIEDTPKGHKIIMDKNGNCPFLTGDGWCSIQREKGEEALGTICSAFPRIAQRYKDIQCNVISFACPEAARIYLHREELVEFRLYEGIESVDEEDDLWYQLFMLEIQVVQYRFFSLKSRLKFLVDLNIELEKCGEDRNAIQNVITSWSEKTQIDRLLENYEKGYSLWNYEAKVATAGKQCSKIFQINKAEILEVMNSVKSFLDSVDVCEEKAKLAFQKLQTKTYQNMYENYCVYYIHRFFFDHRGESQNVTLITRMIYMLNLIQLCHLSYLVNDKLTDENFDRPRESLMSVISETSSC